jgi:hypothetical protein
MVQQRIIAQLEKETFEVSHTCLLNADCVDQAFWLAQLPCKVVGVTEVHAVAGSNGGGLG